MQPVIPEDSPLRQPPASLSRRQILILDGLRYAVEMADVAYQRLYDGLQDIARSHQEPSTRSIAAIMLDAWSVVDSVHRFVDLAGMFPGLKKKPWLTLLQKRTADVLDLRDDVQHQEGRLETLTSQGGQIWGYISWAEVDASGQYTGKWLMISPGAVHVGDKWFYVGPARLPFAVRRGRIRLNAFGRQVYLSRALDAILEAIRLVEAKLLAGEVRPQPELASDRQDADIVLSSYVEVLVSNQGVTPQ